MKNKARHKFKQNGTRYLPICNCCGYINCDPMYANYHTPAGRKLEYRKRNGLCIGCGKKECKCKNKKGY